MISSDYKYIKTLEFDKILNMLKNEAACELTKEIISDLKPYSDFDNIIQEMEKTNDAYKLMIGFKLPQINFKSNLNMIINKARLSAQLTISELLIVSNFLSEIQKLVRWKRQSENLITKIDYLFDDLILIKDLKKKIDDVILSEDEISDSASENLFNIRKKLRRSLSKVKDSLETLIRSATYQKYLQEPIVTIRDARFVVPVKSEYRAEVKGLIHDSSTSGATLFIEPISVVEANNEIKILEKEENEEIERILKMLSSLVHENINDIIKDYDLLIKIDLYFSKAKLGDKMNAIVPKINNQGRINLIKARHPLIDKEKVVPIDINLGYNFDSLIITGPNTGGKTVALKTVGLLTVMAMSGLMIPAAENSEISIFKNILVDIGDEQSIEQSLSTFSAHMVNIISILNMANKDSLVLIDELGAGTDPIEGASLAISILDELKVKKSKLIATTHYSEIKLYAFKTDGVKNASCEFDIETLKPTYRLSIGIPGKSNAFLISKRLGLSDVVLDRAKMLTGEERNKFEDVISDLEKLKLETENKKDEINKLKEQIELEKANISQMKTELEKNKKIEIEKAKKEANKIINDVKRESKDILNELEKILKEKENENFYKMALDVNSKIKSKFKYIEDISDPVSFKSGTEKVISGKKIEIGDKVKLLDINQYGVVVSNKDKNGYYFVQIGMIKKKEHVSNLVLIEIKNNKLRTVINKNVRKKSSGKIDSEIHLRGMTVEEALMELDKFIDDAVILGLKTVRIVHGKGTGTLRAAVGSYLRSNKFIDNYKLGSYGEGEDGVTIATLK